MQLTFLGTANAFFSGGRAHASVLCADRQGHFLLECGATTPFLLRRRGVDPASIDSILISHLHGDHFAGLAFFLLDARDESARKNPLHLIGPLGLKTQLLALLVALYPESDFEHWPFDLHYLEMSSGETREVAGRGIQALRADHMSDRYLALGFRIQTEGKVIAFTGDTGPAAPLEELANHTDLFICECTLANQRPDAPPMQHLSPADLARRREAWTSKRIIVTHLSRDSRLEAARLSGVEVADDGMELEL